METKKSAEIITKVEQYEIQSLGRNTIIVTTNQNLLNALKGTLNMYSNGRCYAQKHKGRT